MMLALPLGALGLLGLLVGLIVAVAAASYSADRRFWPWPRDRACGPGTPRALPLAYVRFVICLYHARHGHVPMPRALWMPVAMAALYSGLGVRYVAEPLLLVVSVVEATLLLLLFVIDLEVRLVPTPVVILLVAVALASATLWPGVGLRDALLGGAVGFVGFAALVGLARLLCGPGALGLGDASLALTIGCIVGYPLVVETLTLGIVLAGIAAGALLLLGRVGLRRTIPYGPFLITVALGMLVSGADNPPVDVAGRYHAGGMNPRQSVALPQGCRSPTTRLR